MTIWHLFSIELAVMVLLILTYAFFNEQFVAFEKWVVRTVKRIFGR